MRVFVTGASGWIGSAVVPELVAAGHEVTGLARSDASASALGELGAGVLRGDLDDVDLLRGAAADSDGVIHLAFKHDLAFSGRFEEATDADRRIVEIFGATLAGSDRPLVIASGVLGLAPGRVATEADGRDGGVEASGSGPGARAATGRFTLALAERGVRSSVLRLPPTVHGDGDGGFMASLVAIARARGVSGYTGDGAQRWPAVHRLDAARLFRLALEQAPPGSVLHAVGDGAVPLRTVAEVIGRHLDLPVRAISQAEAGEHFGWLAPLVAVDAPASCAATSELLGWYPVHPGLVEDLDKGHYFSAPAA